MEGEDERRERVLAQAADVLSRQPTPLELAENQARATANKIDRIMNRQPVMHRITENALIVPASVATDERAADVEAMARAADAAEQRIRAAMKRCRSDPERSHPIQFTQGSADAYRAAIHELLTELYSVSMQHRIKRRELEQRVANLELQAKPRHRVKAPGQRVAL